LENYKIDRSEFIPSNDWSISNALHMMKLSYAVYAGTTDNVGSQEDWSVTEGLILDAGYKFQKIEKRKGIHEPNAMVCSDENSVFLIFRGTEPTAWNQWATDAQTFRIPFGDGEVHKGFLSAVELIWPEIISHLQEADPDRKKRLFVGGHSLGAGMSQVASAKLASPENDRSPEAVYNFGCPRALDSVGARIYNDQLGSRTYRVVNNNDIVCRVPLKVMGFSHVGQLKYLTSDGKLRDKLSWVQRMKERWRGKRISGWAKFKPTDTLTDLFPDELKDHLPEEYTKSLESIRD
jgi:triacylglycerol lipase